jgi:hypothetical protein
MVTKMPTFHAHAATFSERTSLTPLIRPSVSSHRAKAGATRRRAAMRDLLRKPLTRTPVHEVVRRIPVFVYRLISTSNTHASNKATRIEKTMPATSQYRPPNPPASTAMPATTNGSVAI